MKNYPQILVLQSDKKELAQVENFLRLLFKEEELPQEWFHKVLLCVSEAVINSIEHGNKNEEGKKVTIEVSCHHKELYITVTDEGDGFNYNEVSDPTMKENIKNETGRGIFIMKSISDKIDFREEGKCVEFKIELV